MDMLHGSLWDTIIIFALPLTLTGILQQLFNAADVAVPGRCVSSEVMAAAGNNTPIIGPAGTLCMGLSPGANVVVARYPGMGATGRVRRAAHAAFALSVLLGLAITLLTGAMTGL